MNSKVVKILFVDFWEGFDYLTSYIFRKLTRRYNIEISNSPDILIYSVFGNQHRKFACTKVFYTGENIRPNLNECDFSFSFDYLADSRNYRLPLYYFYDNVNKLINHQIDAENELRLKTEFCCFIVSNPINEIRNNFFIKLNNRKHVDSGGRFLNNLGKEVDNKREFIRKYKFVIAFENSNYPGYVTEKIYEPFLESCVPIYWGTDLIHKDFNPKRFINYHDFGDMDKLIEHILYVDANDDVYLDYLKQPVFINDELNEYIKDKNIHFFIKRIIDSSTNKSLKAKARRNKRVLILFGKFLVKKFIRKSKNLIFYLKLRLIEN